jgi:hypothetical protein
MLITIIGLLPAALTSLSYIPQYLPSIGAGAAAAALLLTYVESVTIVFCRSEHHDAPGAVHVVLTGRATASGPSRPWRRR